MLTAAEAADLLGTTDGRVRQLCLDGLLPDAAKRAGVWFIPRSSVESYTATKKKSGRPRKRDEPK